jgi:copper transport protein
VTLDVVLRALTIGSTCVLVGLLPIAFLILRRAAAQPDTTREALRLRRVLAAAALVGLVAAAASLVRLVQLFHMIDPAEPLAATAGDVLLSDLGAWTALRLPVLLGLVLVIRTTSADRMQNAAVWAPPAALLCLTLPMTGHAWAHGGAAGVAVDVVHIAAGSVWLAGIIALAVVVPASLRRGSAGRRRETLLQSAVAFSRVAVIAVAVAVVSGFVQPLLGGIRPADVLGSTWGTAAVAKVWLFTAVLVAGLVNHRVLIRRLDRARNRIRIQASSSVLLASVSLELVLGVALVLAAALLVSAPQP